MDESRLAEIAALPKRRDFTTYDDERENREVGRLMAEAIRELVAEVNRLQNEVSAWKAAHAAAAGRIGGSMGTMYAFVVDCPEVFGSKKVILAESMDKAFEVIRGHMKLLDQAFVTIESIVNVGEVLSG